MYSVHILSSLKKCSSFCEKHTIVPIENRLAMHLIHSDLINESAWMKISPLYHVFRPFGTLRILAAGRKFFHPVLLLKGSVSRDVLPILFHDSNPSGFLKNRLPCYSPGEFLKETPRCG